ncbi:hypothetical protein DUI87_22861 [Hirundo rustica rustica]|uniref:Uncharacterized protein n=1 Tax=Hirundo rustica rustica TaxID=333673 RepID=A0A3M0JHU7_HIRRU|nr:hypothetical protein DUI87_22861 [Hirundo rustica rustica]
MEQWVHTACWNWKGQHQGWQLYHFPGQRVPMVDSTDATPVTTISRLIIQSVAYPVNTYPSHEQEGAVGNAVKGFTKVLVDNIH